MDNIDGAAMAEKSEVDETKEISSDKNRALPKFRKTCWFYVNYNYCKFGRDCKFFHPRQTYRHYQKYENVRKGSNIHYQRHSVNTYNRKSYSKDSETSCQSTHNNFAGAVKRQNFRMFTNSKFKVDRSKYESEKTVQSMQDQAIDANSSKQVECLTNVNSRTPFDISNLTKDELENLRKTEIIQLKKRYPNLKEKCERDCDVFSFSFSSSDPDWAFDLNSVEIEVHFSHDYPQKACRIIVLNEDERMPPSLLKHLNQNVIEWIESRYKANEEANKLELVLRPFLRWFDRNLEGLFIEGLKKVKREVEAKRAGFEFVPYSSLPGASSSTQDDEISQDVEDLFLSPVGQNNLEADFCNLNISFPKNEPDSLCDNAQEVCSTSSRSKRGTEVKLIDFELREDAASLQCKKISIRVRCSRCKTYSDIEGVSKTNSYSSTCSKCHQIISVGLNPMLLHSFSSIFGYLHLNGCQAVDLNLVQSQFSIGCLNCNKTNDVSGINYGQAFMTWCLFCNHKLCIATQSVKFIRLQPEERTSKFDGNMVSSVEKKKLKDPVIEAGKPLPNNGTCKHYKRSHRWLRFPCCGKVYPCDVCHDEKETDHEMKFASRMLCGFCSKEQPYSKDKPCISCSLNVVKKSGAHWEGGKGCRDRIKMCREDKQKYAGVSKTISRKAVGLAEKKK